MSYFAVIREAGPGRPARTAVSRIDCPLAVRPAASPHGGPATLAAFREALPAGSYLAPLAPPAVLRRAAQPGKTRRGQQGPGRDYH